VVAAHAASSRGNAAGTYFSIERMLGACEGVIRKRAIRG
jgi:hypothetical protein